MPLLRLARLVLAPTIGVAGAAVLVAWHLHWTPLLQLRESDAPMQFNVALAFLLCAAALFVIERRPRLAAALGGILLLLGAATACQYLTGHAFGIDTWLFDPYLTIHTATPGRMAPNAAICLALIGLALYCLGMRKGTVLAGMASLLGASVAGIAAVGYMIGVVMAYGWPAGTRLDLPSALGLCALGSYLTWHCAAGWRDRPRRWRLLLPAVTVASMTSVTCILWLSLLDAERVQINANANEAADRLIGQATDAFLRDLRALEHLRARGPMHGMGAAGLVEARDVVHDSGNLHAILWVDSLLRVQRVVSKAPDRELERFDLAADLNTLVALERARVAREATLTHLTDWSRQGRGLIAVLPLAEGGFVLGVFDVRNLPRVFVASPYAVELFDGEEKFHSQHDAVQPPPDLVSERKLALLNIGLRVRLWPTAEQVRHASSWHARAVLLAGLCMAALLASVTMLVQLSGARLRTLQCEIAERRKVERENALLMSELQVVFANVSLGIALVRNGVTVRCNERYAQLLGSPLQAIAGRPVAPGHPGECIAATPVGNDGTCHAELELARADGTRFWAACSGKALDLSDASRGMVWVIEDISVRKSMEHRMLFEAQHDSLTGLANRTKFGRSLALALDAARREGRRMAVCYIDLDKFKYVNDTFGHAAGDHLLVTIAQRLSATVRDSDTVARLGGDEFALVLPSAVDRQVVAAVLDRILCRLQEDVQFGALHFAVSGSIGMAMYPDDGDDAQTLLEHADEAMYVAKQAGRNNWRAYMGLNADESASGGHPATRIA